MGETMENRVTRPNSQRPHLKYHLKLKTIKNDAGVSGLGHHIIIWSYSVSELCLTLVILQTVVCQAPLSMGFPRQEY